MGPRRPNQPAPDAPGAQARSGEGLNIGELKEMSIQKLTQIAKDLNVAGATGMRKQELIFQILKAQTEQSGFIFSEGVLEVLPDGFGFLRAPDYNYLPGPGRHLRLARRRSASSTCRPATRSRARSGRPRRGSAISRCIKVEAVNFEHPEQAREKLFFENLTPLYPQERLRLETGAGEPFGAGDGPADADRQGAARPDRRAAADRQDHAAAEHRAVGHHRTTPRSFLIVLLIDERPEEVTDMQRSVNGEVISARPSTSRRSATCRWPRW